MRKLLLIYRLSLWASWISIVAVAGILIGHLGVERSHLIYLIAIISCKSSFCFQERTRRVRRVYLFEITSVWPAVSACPVAARRCRRLRWGTFSVAGSPISREMFEAAGVCERLYQHTPARGSGYWVKEVFLFMYADSGDVGAFIYVVWFVDVWNDEQFLG